MKKQMFTLLLALSASCTTVGLIAQEISKKAGYDLKTSVICRVISTDNGVQLSFNNNIASPRDAATGQASGKRQHKPFSFKVSSVDNAVSEIKSPRDVATGQASGKVSYSDLSVTLSSQTASASFKPQKIMVEDGEFTLPPNLADGTYDLLCSWSWGASNSGSVKRCVVSFAVTIDGGVAMAITEQGVPAKKK